ncbi:lasso RiPP family leader peptide-containing protein [Streptomyces radicis]|uniref:Lasso RiPP family leader peptide-containing protein n=1 Tax=Streptomyces radicis TaxID=1750517 RepID=A0A3A9WBG0_9ACTN|nr:lasso RiPP family leader peptide-containing protein [Streptomyces radicis]RKN24727.1 lasso RiPP family leader peptide-containing protein [Streptomyces radicis]
MVPPCRARPRSPSRLDRRGRVELAPPDAGRSPVDETFARRERPGRAVDRAPRRTRRAPPGPHPPLPSSRATVGALARLCGLRPPLNVTVRDRSSPCRNQEVVAVNESQDVEQAEPTEVYETPLMVEVGEFSADTQALYQYTRPEGNGLRWY